MEADAPLDFRRDIDPNEIYELTSLLGEGSYGAVYRAKTRIPGRHGEVAIKIIPDADDDLTALWREIRFLQVLRSPFVVSFIESFLFDNELWLAMELCDAGSLYDLKEAHKDCFQEEQLQVIMAFCVMGLAHLHAQMSIHRDVKSGNVLLTRDGRAKLGDFGISAQLTDTIMKRRTVIGSPYWMAPEVIQETSYDGKADIWSLGITLLELCEGSPPHFSIHPMRAIFIISSKPAPVLQDKRRWSEDFHDFIGLCLVKDCEKRASAAELMRHRWIAPYVRDIGPTGRGSPILADLIEQKWNDIEKVRVTRFKLPDNIPVGGEGGVGMSQEQQDNTHLDEDNMATMKRSSTGNGTINNNSEIRGVPATRQQLRNASLTRSITPGSNRFRSSSKASLYNDYNDDGGNDGTFVRRPLPALQSSSNYDGTFARALPEGKHSSPDNSQSKSSYIRLEANNIRRSPGFDRDGTLVTKPVGSSRHHAPVMDDDDRDGTMVVRRPHEAKEHSSGQGGNNSGGNNKEGRQEIQAALKYFRDEPTPPAAATSSEPKRHNNPHRAADSKNGSDFSVTVQEKDEPNSLHHGDSEYAALNGLMAQQGGDQADPAKEALKKEIMRQISSLKKQYKEDLEKLTHSYESRRKALKDALLALSSDDPSLLSPYNNIHRKKT